MKLTSMIVGLGLIGFRYDHHESVVHQESQASENVLTHAHALKENDGTVLKYGIDPDERARRDFEELYGTQTFKSLDEWANSGANRDIDIVVICVLSIYQIDVVGKLMMLCKPKLLIVEKPIVVSSSQADILERILENSGGTLIGVNYTRRYQPVVSFWKERISAGELGDFLHGSIDYGKGLLSNGSHFVNLAEYWLGPLSRGPLIRRHKSHLSFDCECSFDLYATSSSHGRITVNSIGGSGMRAGEIDLWFEKGRLT